MHISDMYGCKHKYMFEDKLQNIILQSNFFSSFDAFHSLFALPDSASISARLPEGQKGP